MSSSATSGRASAGGVVGYIENEGSLSNSYGTGRVSSSASAASRNSGAGGVSGHIDSGGIATHCYWDQESVSLRESADGALTFITRSSDLGQGEDHTGMTALTSAQMRGSSGTYPEHLGDAFQLGRAQEYPLLVYGGTVGSDCESLASNDREVDEGEVGIPDCGDLLVGQAVRMALGFLRLPNTEIGHSAFEGTPALAEDPIFFYQVGSDNTISLPSTGVNGTGVGSYALENAAGAALMSPALTETTLEGLSALDAGMEFYLGVAFTKGSERFQARIRLKK